MSWRPEIDLDIPRIRQIVRAQFPEFTDFQPLGQGWDNIAVLADQSTVFRLPRRKIAADIIQNEIAVLNSLHPLLPIPIPKITHPGQPSADFPFHFTGYPYLQGETADSQPWTDQQKLEQLPKIAQFLRILHSIPINQIPFKDLPTNDFFEKDPVSMHRKIQARLDETQHLKLPHSHQSLENWLIQAVPQTDPTAKVALVHGDLYPRHLLVDPQNQVTAIIDWGDVHLNHPAVDLSLAYTFCPPANREEFFSLYSLPVSEDDKRFAQIRALMYGLSLAHYGQDVNDANAHTLGLQILSELPI